MKIILIVVNRGKQGRRPRRAACEHRSRRPVLHANAGTSWGGWMLARLRTRSWRARSASQGYPAAQRNSGAECRPGYGNREPEDGRPRSSSDGLPDQLQRGDKSGQFWECSALERSWRSGRLAKRPKAGRSWSLLPALHRAKPCGAIALASAIPEGSRRSGRRSERDQRERRTCEPFTPREERSDEGTCRTCHHSGLAALSRPGRRPGRRLGFGDSRSLESGLGRFAQAE